jgi:hypothetical protein
MPKMQKILENPKMNFNVQPNIFFDKIISCTYDLHLKLDILNPLNIIFLSNGLKMSFFFALFDLVFHQVHPMNMYFHRRGHAFVVQQI